MFELANYKQEYGSIWVVVIGQYEIPFRLLTWEEYESYSLSLATSKNIVEREILFDIIFQKVVISPDLRSNLFNLPAGVVSSLVSGLFLLSGNLFRSEEDADLFNIAANNARSALERSPMDSIFSLICKAFPSYTPDNLRKKSYQEILKLLAMSETVLEITPYYLARAKEESPADRLKKEMANLSAVDKEVPEELLGSRKAPKRGLPPGEEYRQRMMLQRLAALKQES